MEEGRGLLGISWPRPWSSALGPATQSLHRAGLAPSIVGASSGGSQASRVLLGHPAGTSSMCCLFLFPATASSRQMVPENLWILQTAFVVCGTEGALFHAQPFLVSCLGSTTNTDTMLDAGLLQRTCNFLRLHS